MGRVCEICGRGTQSGRSKSQRGRPKRLGGVGRKTTGVTNRKFKINLQTVHALVDRTPKTLKVCARCIREGRVVRNVK